MAVNSLREAVRFDLKDKEALNNLGGAFQRLGMAHAPQSYDRKALEAACDSYSKAHIIDRFDLYSGLNIALVNILLSKWDAALLKETKEGFRKKLHLCYYELMRSQIVTGSYLILLMFYYSWEIMKNQKLNFMKLLS